jgi:hypothetical protein
VITMKLVGSVGILLTIIGSFILFVPLLFLRTTVVTDAFGKSLFSIEEAKQTIPNYAKWAFSKCWRIVSYVMTIGGLIMQFAAILCT